MEFDEIYKTAIWAVEMAEEYNITITKVMALFDGLSKIHEVEKTKNMIEEGFIQAKGELNGC